ncbi:hypothetical protein B0H10DRAFT_1942599 [Mycena sp. CBHHK59/15]|nr:hypothetical protein B0H10DRAFT_1942599 [Mycena sp. CBHHK59/15]
MLCWGTNFMSLFCSAIDAVKPFCGKIKYLSSHIRECDSVQLKWKQKLEAEENKGSDSDNSATPVTATTSQAVVKKKRQATFEVVPRAKHFKKDHQNDFESNILKFWISLNASFNSIKHPFINLVMKEYIGCLEVTAILTNCLKIINWFSSHKCALLMLLEEQQAINEKRPPGKKWERLKQFVRAGALLDLINRCGEELESAGGDDEDSRVSTAEVIALIDSGKMGPFWTGVQQVSRYLTPLAVVSNVTQGANTCLDHVLVTLAIFLAKRWKVLKHDQDFYILVVFFNPFLCAFFFNNEIHSLSRIGLYHIVNDDLAVLPGLAWNCPPDSRACGPLPDGSAEDEM